MPLTLNEKLLIAVLNNEVDNVREVIELNADIQLQGVCGMSLLMNACILHEQDDIMKLLINNGHNIYLQDEKGRTVFNSKYCKSNNRRKLLNSLVKNDRYERLLQLILFHCVGVKDDSNISSKLIGMSLSNAKKIGKCKFLKNNDENMKLIHYIRNERIPSLFQASNFYDVYNMIKMISEYL